MSETNDQIEELQVRLDSLVKTQIDFQKEVSFIRSELERLRASRAEQDTASQETVRKPLVSQEPKTAQPPSAQPRPRSAHGHASRPEQINQGAPSFGYEQRKESQFSAKLDSMTAAARSDLEKFIGENLISKIGIVVLVLGVGIGAKYAIDNNLISPLTRIIIGYIFGFGLIGLAIRLKPKYLNFSSVLISGGMAIMYFVTYFAYTSYSLIPQSSAFALMTMFTAFTVAAALMYNRQIIAHIGLVGAYAVPFLLSDGSGNYLVLFAYMTIINTGILAISVKKFWKPLFYTSSAFTWIIFLGWFATKYRTEEHFYLALVFLALFFSIFYSTRIAQEVFHAEADNIENMALAGGTAVIFFGFCFALSDVYIDVGKYWIFFTYLAVISIGILLTSYRFYGRFLVYLTFGFTWLIFGAWYLNRYNIEEHFYLAATFATIFFAIFYCSILAHRLIADNLSFIENAGLVLTNSFLFYGFGYSIVSHESLNSYLGLYTVGHAGLHFVVAHLVNRFRSSAVDVVQVLTILILTFASISIPVQFDGNYVTLIWSVEACLLFWFGRVKQIRLFEYFSYPIMALAAFSLFLDWAKLYADRTLYISDFNRQPLANGDLVTAMVFVAAFVFIFITNRDDRFEPAIGTELVRPVGIGLAAIGLFVLYNAFRIEISNYYHMQAVAARPADGETPIGLYADLDRLNIVWQINYSMFFLVAMCAANLRKFWSKSLAYVNAAFGLFAIAVFATLGMVMFHELRQSYMSNIVDPLVTHRYMYIAVRYLSYAFAGGLLYSLYRYSRGELLADAMPRRTGVIAFDALLSVFVLIAASCELINLMGQFYVPDAYKLGLSVLWGVYALVLIVLGIAWNKKHLRVGAFVLLGVTLAKLFLYDIAELDTISKTILFVTLGVTMLVVSFLYNKYKSMIIPAEAETDQ